MKNIRLLGLTILLLTSIEAVDVSKKGGKKLHLNNKSLLQHKDATTDDAQMQDMVAFSQAVAEGKTAEEAVQEAAQEEVELQGMQRQAEQ